MASTTIENPKGTGTEGTASPHVPDVETARQVHTRLRQLIKRAMDPSSTDSTSTALREFTLWIERRAGEDGIVLSEDDYVDLIDAITRVELGSKVGFLISQLIGLPKEADEWSGGMAAMQQFTFVEHE